MEMSEPLFNTPSDIPSPVLSIDDASITSNITMYGGAEEMIKITRDGFYVRGVKVPQDEREAEAVYEAFKQWMSYMALTRNY